MALSAEEQYEEHLKYWEDIEESLIAAKAILGVIANGAPAEIMLRGLNIIRDDIRDRSWEIVND